MGARFVPNVPLAQKSFWTHPVELLGDVGHVESCFGPFGDRGSVGARYVHGLNQMYHRFKIILQAPDGTPRLRGSCRILFLSIWIQC